MCLIHDEDEVDDDVQERLTEDHEQNKRDTDQAAEELGAESGTTELAAHHKRVPVNCA